MLYCCTPCSYFCGKIQIHLQMKEYNVPNLFSVTTSNLSQDTLFAWLLQCSDDAYQSSDKDICQLGKRFMSLMTHIPADDIHKVKVGRQIKDIDIWAEINDDTFLVIEDKTGTTVYDKKLSRHREIVENHYKDKSKTLRFAYIKLENESRSLEWYIEEEGYDTIYRGQLLEVFNSYTGDNPIVKDYKEHLQSIEDKTNAYRTLPVSQWKEEYVWQGFFTQLEKTIDFVDEWEYVDNKPNGFMGLWTIWQGNQEVKMYLQFENSKLCVKLDCKQPGNESTLRKKYHSKLMQKSAEAGVKINKPKLFGKGVYMTIGVVDSEEVFPGGICDLDNLKSKLNTLNELIIEIIQESK